MKKPNPTAMEHAIQWLQEADSDLGALRDDCLLVAEWLRKQLDAAAKKDAEDGIVAQIVADTGRPAEQVRKFVRKRMA